MHTINHIASGRRIDRIGPHDPKRSNQYIHKIDSNGINRESRTLMLQGLIDTNQLEHSSNSEPRAKQLAPQPHAFAPGCFNAALGTDVIIARAL